MVPETVEDPQAAYILDYYDARPILKQRSCFLFPSATLEAVVFYFRGWER